MLPIAQRQTMKQHKTTGRRYDLGKTREDEEHHSSIPASFYVCLFDCLPFLFVYPTLGQFNNTCFALLTVLATQTPGGALVSLLLEVIYQILLESTTKRRLAVFPWLQGLWGKKASQCGPPSVYQAGSRKQAPGAFPESPGRKVKNTTARNLPATNPKIGQQDPVDAE